ncbi:MAG TPA: choice-of-anchor Q domain-containing protein [Terrimesophilobacter sp.]|nr:choice-of-anchor Q domain-containing protein [Terrimesophilobacter sp.]
MKSSRSRRLTALISIMGLALLGVVATPMAASAAVLTVTSGADSGAGTLREAIANANSGDSITFHSAVTSITLDDPIVIDKSLQIVGPGMDILAISTLSGLPAPEWPYFVVNGATADVVFSDLALVGPGVFDILRAIDVDDAASLMLDGVRVSGFVSAEGAVSLDAAGASLTIRNSEFLSNENAITSGGAVSGSVSTAAIIDSTFDRNTAGVNGGAVALSAVSGNVTITGGTFTLNEAGSGSGGAIYAGTIGGSALISAGTYTENYAGDNGGAIAMITVTSDFEVTGSSFEFNDADGDGGAVYLGSAATSAPSLVSVSDATFTENRAADGGAFWVGDVGTRVTVEDSDFVFNSATSAGGIHFAGTVPATGEVRLDGITFERNNALDGGGVLIGADVLASVTVTHSTFSGNDAVAGAGLYADLATASLTVEFSTFRDNIAGEDGGGVFLVQVGTADPSVVIDSSTFSGHTSAYGGIGLSLVAELSSGALTVENSTFNDPGGFVVPPYAMRFSVADGGSPMFAVNNSTIVAQGGIAFMAESAASAGLSVSHTIIDSLGAPAITESSDDPGDVFVEWSVLSGGVDALVSQGVGNQLGVATIGLGALQGNGGPTWTMLPAATSPAVNAGDPSFAGLTLDQRGTGFDRVVDVIDIGAVEVQAGSTGGGGLADTGAGEVTGIAVGGAGILLLGLLLWVLVRRRAVC